MTAALVLLAAATQPVPTFTRDIAPILYRECVACHRPGEAAPFSLLDYEDTKKHAKQIAAVTHSRYMPPWLPEHGKGDFAGERRLSEAEIRTIAQWTTAGAPEGDPKDLPPKPRFVAGWQLGQPDLVLTLEAPYTLAAGGGDVFRNFVLPAPVSKTKYVRAIEVRPGNKRIVHHANVLLDRSGWARRQDGKDADPGVPGMDIRIETQGFDPDSHFLFWKPGTSYSEEPPGMAWKLEPGTDLVLNTHLQPSGKAEQLQPSIGLYFTDQAPTKQPMLVQLEHDGALDIPAGEKAFVVTDTLTLPVDVDLLGIYPHAHYIGKDLQGFATLPDGTKRWLIHIPDWDINWQAVYRYKQPVFLPKGTVLSMRYSIRQLGGQPPQPEQSAETRHQRRSLDRRNGPSLAADPATRPGDRPHARAGGCDAAPPRQIPGDFLAQYSLGALLQARGDLAGAEGFYRKALDARPSDPAVHNALGALLLSSGKIENALTEFQKALAADPDYANAHYNLGRIFFAQRPARRSRRAVPRRCSHRPARRCRDERSGRRIARSWKYGRGAHHSAAGRAASPGLLQCALQPRAGARRIRTQRRSGR